jgi:hypothetical protein
MIPRKRQKANKSRNVTHSEYKRNVVSLTNQSLCWAKQDDKLFISVRQSIHDHLRPDLARDVLATDRFLLTKAGL